MIYTIIGILLACIVGSIPGGLLLCLVTSKLHKIITKRSIEEANPLTSLTAIKAFIMIAFVIECCWALIVYL